MVSLFALTERQWLGSAAGCFSCVSIWARAGTGDAIPSKAHRYGMIVLPGLIAVLAGPAALLGARAVPE